jgi:glycosyltransferase involved in cell wall biosynthesis
MRGNGPRGERFAVSRRVESMTTSCLISNYNYGHFLGEALDSVLAQTAAIDEIIVVDDGSTDTSAEVLTQYSRRHPTIKVVAKKNQGQLSCFNEGFARAAGDIVFFLDGDDLYEPNYVERALAMYDRHPQCDFVACGLRQFGEAERVRLEYQADQDLGYSVILTAYLREWIGAATSCLSMRRGVLEKILPLPFCEDWRTRADDCLVFGASLAGARKYYLAQPLVRYRVHGANHYCRRGADKFAAYRRRLAINRLFAHLERTLCYDPGRLGDFHHREFCTIARPTLSQFVKYVRIGMASPISPLRQLACVADMTRHFLRSAMRRQRDAQDSAQEAIEVDAPPLLVYSSGESATGARTAGPHNRRRQAA